MAADGATVLLLGRGSRFSEASASKRVVASSTSAGADCPANDSRLSADARSFSVANGQRESTLAFDRTGMAFDAPCADWCDDGETASASMKLRSLTKALSMMPERSSFGSSFYKTTKNG